MQMKNGKAICVDEVVTQMPNSGGETAVELLWEVHMAAQKSGCEPDD